MENYDIVIIGGATSGAYFALKMAKKGHRVKIIEKLSAEKLGTRMDIFHVSQTDLKTFDIPAVREGDKEWAFEFTENHFSSPSNRYSVHSTAETVGLHMHEYVALMVKRATDAGAEIEYCFANRIIFNETFLDNGKVGAADVIKTVTSVISGMSGKHISAKTVAGVLQGAALGFALLTHYNSFPEKPDGYEKWCRTSEKLWKKVGRVK